MTCMYTFSFDMEGARKEPFGMNEKKHFKKHMVNEKMMLSDKKEFMSWCNLMHHMFKLHHV
jgi:hypothetical protein